MPAIGRQFNIKYKLGAQHALYRRDGKWFHHLQRFPGILCDESGFVRFRTKEEYQKHPSLQHGQDLHVPDGIASMSSYIRFPDKKPSDK
ncbi:MAG TPA: hypothetical protein VN048_15430, partial [Verrucomicrobiae bacterium]|nr:hypothetical protein [Verrucomicrobiae bacterium]